MKTLVDPAISPSFAHAHTYAPTRGDGTEVARHLLDAFDTVTTSQS